MFNTLYIIDLSKIFEETFYWILPVLLVVFSCLIGIVIICYTLFIVWAIIFDKTFQWRHKSFLFLSVALLVMTIILTIRNKQVNPGFDVTVAIGTTIIAIAEILLQNYTSKIPSRLITWIRRAGFVVILIAYYFYWVDGSKFSYASQLDSGKIGIIGIALLLLSIAVENKKLAEHVNKRKINDRLIPVCPNCKVILGKGRKKKRRKCENCDQKAEPDFYKYEKVT